MTRTLFALMTVAVVAAGCTRTNPADLLLLNARVYTMSWDEPNLDGRPADNAPYGDDGWHPDAEAIAIRGDRIVFVGSRILAERHRGEKTIVRDLGGATVLPGLIETHAHIENFGASLERVSLLGVTTEAEAVARVAAKAATVPKGEWIIGWGWDEGAWASRYPDMKLLSQRIPDHPVLLHGLHTFASWSNKLAFERAGITAATPAPAGGEIKKDRRGQPTGILMNNATRLVEGVVPAPTAAQLESRLITALNALTRAGYVAVQEAGANAALLNAYEWLASARPLPLKVHVMLAARDTALLDTWVRRKPDTDDSDRLVVRSVKAFYDGAMGSRGAYFLEDYTDHPGHRGAGGAAYGFDAARLRGMVERGFQPVIHAIGDRANREALDFMASVPKELRPRIEHAQVVNPADQPRFASLGVIASMQPAHAVEDVPWAFTRLGPERIKHAYAWRSLRRAGARLVFNSDLPASDYNIFYGLHSAVAWKDKEGKATGPWRPQERMTIEEAVRGWTTWAAYAIFEEGQSGVLAVGRKANITVMDIDPFQTGDKEAWRLLAGRIDATIVDGKVIYERAR